MDAEARYALRQQLNAQRTRDARSGSIAPSAAGLPEALTGDEPQFVKDYFDYYKTKRGFHPRSINSNGAWNATSALSFLNMPLLAYAGEIRSAVLLVHGEKAHSRYFSEDAFKKLSGNNKELMIVPRASHTDLYDRVDIIPFISAGEGMDFCCPSGRARRSARRRMVRGAAPLPCRSCSLALFLLIHWCSLSVANAVGSTANIRNRPKISPELL